MEFRPLISVIIPVYNVEPYLRECVDSVVAQTFQNFEIILVDDGSTDNGGTLCDEYALAHTRIRAFHQENRGLSEARNTGIREAAGEYLYFLDSDDLITDDCLESFVSIVKDKKYDIVESYYRNLDYSSPVVKLHLPTGPIEHKDILHQFCIRAWTIHAWNKLVKTQFIRENNLMFTPGIIFEDDIWTFMLACKAQSLFILHEETYIHRIRTGSIISSLKCSDSIKARITILKEIERFSRHNSLSYDSDVLTLVFRLRGQIDKSIRLEQDKAVQKELFFEFHKCSKYALIKVRKLKVIGLKRAFMEAHMFLPTKLAINWWKTFHL